MSAKSGYTLIELLVVITIMALVGAYALSNFGSFGKDQKLKNAVLDVVSLLRQAQTNATSGAKCLGVGETGWLVVYTSSTSLDLECKTATTTSPSLKTLSLTAHSSNITISSITDGIYSCAPGKIFTFAPPSGTMTSDCGSDTVTITLTNGTSSKSLIIEQGGRIYAQ